MSLELRMMSVLFLKTRFEYIIPNGIFLSTFVVITQIESLTGLTPARIATKILFRVLDTRLKPHSN